MDERPLIELKGIIIAAAWGPNGEVSEVDMAGYDEKRYRIADDSVGRQLVQLVKKAVVIRGIIDFENQQNVVHVQSFRRDNAESTAAGPD